MTYGSLTLHLPTGETAVVDLTVSEVVLGRGQQATLRLQDELISKQHVRLIVRSDDVWLEDLGATNGTFVDGKQIPANQPVAIKAGQSVQIGETVFQYAPPPRARDDAAVTADAAAPWRKPLIIALSILIGVLLCGIIGASAWLIRANRTADDGMPPNGVPLVGGVALAACAELPMTAVSPADAPYQLLPFLDLPFAYGDTPADFRQAMQRTANGGRVNAFYDHLLPLYPAAPASAAQGREPLEPLTGGHVLLFTGQLNATDNYSGHPGYDFAPEDPRQPATAVLAAAAGLITEAGIDESGSHFVTLVHTVEGVGSFQTGYWHLQPDSFFVDTRERVGQPITNGERLGTMGGSGWGAGSQLHFEVRFDYDQNGRFTLNEAIDPFAFQPGPAYPQDPWSQPLEFTDGRGEPASHAPLPSLYLWRIPHGFLGQVNENGGGAVPAQGESGLNQISLCAPAGSLPAGGAVTFAWSPDPAAVPGRLGVGLGCALSAADVDGVQVTQFAQPLRLEVPLDAADLSRVNPETAVIYWQEASSDTWQALPTFMDESGRIAVVEVTGPGACTLLGEPLTDVQAPVSTIQVDGSTGSGGFWYEAVTVSIASEDVGGGSVAQIEYSLDAGQTWQPYTGPFTLEPDGSPAPPRVEPVEDLGSGPGRFLVLAAAVDQAGNRENPPAFRSLIIDPAQSPDAAASETPLPETGLACQPELTAEAEFGVNVRRGPGVQYPIATTLPQGATAPIIGRNASGSWWQVALDVGLGSQYWVSDDVVAVVCIDDVPVVATPPPPTATATPTPTATPTATATPTPTATPTATSSPTADPDVVPPTVTIVHAPTTPNEADPVTFTAQAVDAGAVARLEIWVQGPDDADLIRVKVCTDVTVCVYQGGPYAAGEGQYRAFAWDAADNQGITAVITFTVEAAGYP
ncbi:MAG: FHA domain-containing protein [Chloroflexota bacterium]